MKIIYREVILLCAFTISAPAETPEEWTARKEADLEFASTADLAQS